MVSVRGKGVLFLLVLGMGCVILLCHPLGLPYNYANQIHNTDKYKHLKLATDVSIIAIFTNLDASVNVDHSTNVGEVVYTLMNGNDTRSIEIETSGSGIYGLNPSNDRK